MRFQEADIIELRYSIARPICHRDELREFLLSPHLLPHHRCGFGLIASQIMRPKETAYLNWYNKSFNIDVDQNRIIEMQHPAYKARIQTLPSNLRKITYLMLKKPFFSRWLSDALLRYRQEYGECYNGQVFPWTTGGALDKAITRLRNKHGIELPFLHERLNDSVKGKVAAIYRVHPYTFRHFAFTFHYWVTFNQDIISLKEFAGHESVETTWGYVHSKEEIGLTDEMIAQGISWDQFVFGIDLRQAKINQYIRPAIQLPVPPKTQGQRSILNYMVPDSHNPLLSASRVRIIRTDSPGSAQSKIE